jgi:hypothetical protein
MIVTINDLQIGDEVVISSYSSVIFGKVIRRTKANTVVLSTKMVEISSEFYSYKVYVYEPDCSKHNTKKYIRQWGDAL